MEPANPYDPPLASPPNPAPDDPRGRRPLLRLLPMMFSGLLSVLCLLEALWAAAELAVAVSRGPTDTEPWRRLVRDACLGVPLFLASGAALFLAARSWYAWSVRRAIALTAVGIAVIGVLGPLLGLNF